MKRLIATTDSEKDLKRRMRQFKIYEKDLHETFVRSSGPGGQNVNKVSTCVMLLHGPSGIQVKCQEARAQHQNRYAARMLLVQKVERQIKKKKQDALQKKEKLKRQNRKRPKHVKEEMLRRKNLQSRKKDNRRKIRTNKLEGYE